MKGFELINYFERNPLLKRHFLGVCGFEQVKKSRFHNRTFLIVNRDKASLKALNICFVTRLKIYLSIITATYEYYI